MRISVVVPTLREAENLPELVARVAGVREASGLDLELIIVDEASGDGAPDLIKSIGRPWARCIERTGRHGLSAAVIAGVRASDAEVVVVMDADLSHPPERIPALAREIERGAEMAIGSRRTEGGSIDASWSAGRRLASVVAGAPARPLVGVRDPMSGFLAFRREVIERCEGLRPRGFKIGLELMVRAGLRDVREVPIEFADRTRGQSKAGAGEAIRYLGDLARLYWFALALRSWRRGVGVCPPATRARTRDLALCALIVVLAVAGVFGRSAGFGFLSYDDRFHVHENPLVAGEGADRFARAWAGAHGNLYVPLTYNLMRIEGEIADRGTDAHPTNRFDPRVFHATSIGLHAMCAVLVLLILARLTGGLIAPLAGALVFALHPIQVEAVAWVSEQRGLLSSVLALASIWWYLAATDPGRDRSSVAGLVVAGLLFVASMLAKPASAPLPLALVAIDVMLRGVPGRVSVMRLWPWLGAAMGLLVATRLMQSSSDVRGVAPLWLRPFVAGDALAFYAWKVAWPFGLSPDHGRTPGAIAGSWWTYWAWIVPLALLVGALWRRWLHGGAGLIVMFVMLGPVLGLVTFHHQNISTVADRYAYLPMLGIAMAFAGLVSLAPRRALGPGLLIVAGLGIASWIQAGVWKDDVSLWAHAARVQPGSALSKNNLGYALYERGDAAGAWAQFERALAIDPDVGLLRENAALALRDLGRAAESESLLRDELDANPGNARAMSALGAVLAVRGALDGAEPLFVGALAIDPSNADALVNLGVLRMGRGDAFGAEEMYRRAVEADPWKGEAWLNLGVILRASGRTDEAAGAFERAIACAGPVLLQAHQRLGDLLLASGDPAQASVHLEVAIELSPGNAKALNNLGLARVRLGDLDGAIEAFAGAIEADPGLIEARTNLESATRLREQDQQ